MLETRQTNRFALLFFLYFIGVTLGLAFFPPFYSLSYAEQSTLDYVLAFLPPIYFYFLFTKKSPRKTLRLKPLGWKNLVLVVLLSFAVKPLMAFFSYFSQLFFPNPVEASSDAIYSSSFLPMLFTIAVLPAVFEELVMRGIVLSGYRSFGTLKASLATGFLFAMLHLSPQQFLYAFCVGALFCVLVQRTGSIFSSMIPHFLINADTVIGIFSAGTDTSAAVSPPATILFIYVSIFALLSLPILAGLLYLFFKVNPLPAEPAAPLTEKDPLPKARFFTPSILLLCVVYILLGILPELLS